MSAIDQDFVRDLIERHSDASGGNGRDFHNGAYARMADEIEQAVAATLGPCNDSCNCTNGERTGERTDLDAATLGRGTCHITDNGPWGYPYVCSACGASFDPDVNNGEFNYCPNCGRKVVD